MRSRTRRGSLVLVSLGAAFFFVVTARSFAGPDPGVIDGSTATFSGNQSNGVLVGVDFACPPVAIVIVSNLTTDITPASGVGVGIAHWANDGGNGGAYSDGGNGASFFSDEIGIIFLGHNGITVARDWGLGLVVGTGGGDGGNGGNAYGGLSAGDGGHGGYPAQSAAVYSDGYGPIHVSPSSGILGGCDGILVQSRGGSGGDGGGAYGLWCYGGDGGRGRNGGHVDVFDTFSLFGSSTGNAIISVDGKDGGGIVAQSIGGAGGNGGSAYAAYADPGHGGNGGQGGEVFVIGNRLIETTGSSSEGVHAQSIGGPGGGSGGAGGIISYGSGAGSGGDGGYVIVRRGGSVSTWGDQSHAICAQSIGGGGGSAGDTGGVVAIGGSGAGGGNGGEVEVTITQSALQTQGHDAVGILAQSIGGGGGEGGGSGGLVSLGGSGNSSGDGGVITITASGGILTSGWGSDGILGQSIGGGGGRARASGGGISFGGQGGTSGSGGNVAITNQSSLATGGANACGISAQSIGGGGGRGGAVYGAGPGLSTTFGGSAGGGGSGGAVNIWNKNVTIDTAGDLSHGIQAQNIGGGGGSGGDSVAAALGVVVTCECAIGGSGGAGGLGGQVLLRNDGQVTTQGRHAHALFAESLGGGGGSGGRAVSLSATIGVPDLPGLNLSYTIGGSGGDGGNGAAVTVDNHGNLTTSKSRSYGILGQSVGGGGGDGGNSLRGGLTFLASDLSLKIGGSGGLGGNGGSVVIDSTGNISTQGNSAYGAMGQSIGGGGGSGGDSLSLSIDIGNMEEILQGMITPSISQFLTVGGSGGDGGAGATVDVTNKGAIGTQGNFAHGVLAQSVGGGGGASGDECVLEFAGSPSVWDQVMGTIPLSATLKTVGSAGGGGAVTVDNQDNITTQGKFAQGILAQSVGGGGGASGINIHDPFELINPTSSPELTIRGGSGGGAAVTVTNSADIATQGGFAHGILAQSVGGGGGFACISECILGSVLDKLPGAMGVTLADTPGLGIGFVGSATGSGSAGAVTVTAGGHITANGVNSHGILAQSVGSSRGNISVTISGIVQGGTGDGAGVMIDGGAANALTNTGSVCALSGRAIVAGIGGDTVHNYGTITGTVSLGSGANAFNNYAGATFNSGGLVDLGAGMLLTNAGVISPGGAGIVAETALVGNLVQAAGGVLEADVGCSPGGALFDCIDITGNLTLNDAWTLRLCDAGGTTSAEEQYDLFTFAGTYTGLMSFGPGNIDAGGTGWDVYSASIVVDPATPGAGRVYLTGLDSSRLAGDADCDGVVGAPDYIILKKNMGTSCGSGPAEGDFDHDGAVCWKDLQTLLCNFGGCTAAPNTIPEPACLSLLALGGLAAIRRNAARPGRRGGTFSGAW